MSASEFHSLWFKLCYCFYGLLYIRDDLDAHDDLGAHLPLPCQYAFPREKLQWQGPSRSHPMPRTLGIGYHVIFHPFPLFLLSGRDSSIIFFQLLSPVFPLHPLTSRFVMLSHPRM